MRFKPFRRASTFKFNKNHRHAEPFIYIYTYTWNWDSIRMISIFQRGRLSFHSFLVQMAKTLQLKKSQVN